MSVNILQFAQQMERDGENYRELAEKSEIPGLKTIFTSMADDEVKHFNILKAMEEGMAPEMSLSAILTDAKNVFASMRETPPKNDPQQDAIDAFKHALEVETNSAKFYREKAEDSDDPEHKELLLKLATEEEMHCHLLGGILEYMSRPTTWLEDAEFNHLDNY